MGAMGATGATGADDALSYLFRNRLPFLMYLQPAELNDLLTISREAHAALQDDAIWRDALTLNQRLEGIRIFPTCMSLAYAPNEILSVDLAFLPDRRHWGLCRMLCGGGGGGGLKRR